MLFISSGIKFWFVSIVSTKAVAGWREWMVQSPRQQRWGSSVLGDKGIICSSFSTNLKLRSQIQGNWCLSDRASWIDYILIINLMHWLLFIHKILLFSTCFEPQVLIFRRIQLYTCSIWYCHSLWEFVVACRYTVWVRTDCGGRLLFRVGYSSAHWL